ncbi:hypothetical protein PHYPSEUDO_011494 [Phytophthora pseudosyringae]|uniref:Uncharacterized protein n=1 Tax=Phytophthora pseudosyringae TaxID=221518 RepID=A0A8T1V8C0_9STRA|nr:hypothetical protein PHYPSEUDO_011494 [Phytophthora pseudosyringae]
MTSRPPTAGTRTRGKLPGNGRSAAPRAAATFSTTASRGFVEFHSSMSLENAPTLADCLAVSSEARPSSNATCQPSDEKDATLKSVLADRLHVWTKVTEVC